MNKLHKIIYLCILLFTSTIGVNAQAECKLAKSYIITITGSGYSVAGKLTTSKQSPVGDYEPIPSNFIGAMAFTKAESYVRPPSMAGIGSINFAANCDMNAEIDLNGLPLTFTAYFDDTANANGVLIGGVVLLNDKVIGVTGAIRVADKR